MIYYWFIRECHNRKLSCWQIGKAKKKKHRAAGRISRQPPGNVPVLPMASLRHISIGMEEKSFKKRIKIQKIYTHTQSTYLIWAFFPYKHWSKYIQLVKYCFFALQQAWLSVVTIFCVLYVCVFLILMDYFYDVFMNFLMQCILELPSTRIWLCENILFKISSLNK